MVIGADQRSALKPKGHSMLELDIEIHIFGWPESSRLKSERPKPIPSGADERIACEDCYVEFSGNNYS